MDMSTSVLAIDDDKFIHEIINKVLENNDLLHAYNGEQGIKIACDEQPDIILLDVEMPGLNGFEVCHKLKEQTETKDIPVMFLSSRSSIEERIRGYNSGADDYIVKPFESQELQARINVLFQYKVQSQSLKQDIEQAQNTAAVALTDYSDMGRAMRYVSQTYCVKSYDKLAEYFFEFFAPLNLNVVTAFWHENDTRFFANHGAVCPLEKELMENARQGQRFIDFGCRTIINYPNISLLVKNMPLDDAALYGRYKDLFPHILEATDAKLLSLDINNKISKQAQEITKTFELVDSTLRKQIESLYSNSQISVELIETLYQGFCDSIPRLALESDQEEYILGSVEQTVEKLREHLSLGDEIQTSFNEVMSYMAHIMQERKEIIEKFEQEHEHTSNVTTTQDDIELF